MVTLDHYSFDRSRTDLRRVVGDAAVTIERTRYYDAARFKFVKDLPVRSAQ